MTSFLALNYNLEGDLFVGQSDEYFIIVNAFVRNLGKVARILVDVFEINSRYDDELSLKFDDVG